MYRRERFIIDPSPTIPTYVYVDSYQPPVLYQYPSQILIRDERRSDVLLSETSAIRSELSQIRSDIGEIRRRQTPPAYYLVSQDYSSDTCSLCGSSFPKNIGTYCDRCGSFVEEPTYSFETKVRPNTPNTTYQDSYKRPPQYMYPVGHLERRITLNELQSEPLPSSSRVQHSRHWISSAYKNAYPHRNWNLSVPHPAP